jgi:hypothetical protein
MAARTKKAKIAATTAAASTTPWVQRLVEDEELRDNFRVAFEAAKDAYERVSDGKGAKALVADKKVQKDIEKAANALKDAGASIKDGPKKRPKKRHPLRKLLLVVVAAGVALAVSEDLRTKVLDALFGKEEEFEYASTPAPTPPTGA